MDPIAYALASTLKTRVYVPGSPWTLGYAASSGSGGFGRQDMTLASFATGSDKVTVFRNGYPETYNTSTDSWTNGAPPSIKQGISHGGWSKLADGRIMVTGGYISSPGGPSHGSEIYNPATNTWAAGPALVEHLYDHVQVTLDNGDVMVIGGMAPAPGGGRAPTVKTWLFPGGTGSPVRKADLPYPLGEQTPQVGYSEPFTDGRDSVATNIPAGFRNGTYTGNKVVAFNNNYGSPTHPSSTGRSNATYMYDVATNTWSLKAYNPHPKFTLGGCVTLPDGTVALAGGVPLEAGGHTYTANDQRFHVDLYDPFTNKWNDPLRAQPLPKAFQGIWGWHLSLVRLPDDRIVSIHLYGPEEVAIGRINYVIDSAPRATLLSYLAST